MDVQSAEATSVRDEWDVVGNPPHRAPRSGARHGSRGKARSTPVRRAKRVRPPVPVKPTTHLPQSRTEALHTHMRLVTYVARRYVNQANDELGDLVQEGTCGLMRALDKYDPDRGTRFSTYAVWWIRQAIERSMADQGRLVRIPVHALERVRQLRNWSRELTFELGRTPTATELAEEFGESREQVEMLLEATQHPVSLDVSIGDDDRTVLADLLPAPDSDNPEVTAMRNEARRAVPEILATLPQRTQQILTLRYGLDGGPPHTMEEVGHKLGLTRERIRQIERKAFRSIETSPELAHLRDYATLPESPEPPSWFAAGGSM